MQTNPLPFLKSAYVPAPLPTARPDAQNQREFSQILAIDRRGRHHSANDHFREQAPDKAQEAAEQLIAVTFVEPILKQAREVRSSEGPFGITQAEKQFGAMLDAQTARRMVANWHMPLVERLARDMRAATVKTGGSL